MFANVTPIVGPPKKWKIAIHAIQTVFVDPSRRYWQYSWVTSAPFVPSKDREQKASKNVSLLSVSLFVYNNFEKHRSHVYLEVC